MGISPLAAFATIGKTQSTDTSIAGDFDTFLKILTTQLQNQNPLEPLDTNEFTSQLVQFSVVEQEIKSNQNLERLIALQGASAFAGVVSYIGKEVVAAGSETNLSNGSASWSFNLTQDAPTTKITIRNELGAIVKTETISADFGSNSYLWDGKTLTGGAAPDGLYSITVEATDADDNRVDVSTTVKGIVDGIDLSGNEPFLTISGVNIKLSSVREIAQPATP